VLEQVEASYDANGNVLLTTIRQRFHDESGMSELGTAMSGVKARVSYAVQYYDKAERETASVNVGTNGGTTNTAAQHKLGLANVAHAWNNTPIARPTFRCIGRPSESRIIASGATPSA